MKIEIDDRARDEMLVASCWGRGIHSPADAQILLTAQCILGSGGTKLPAWLRSEVERIWNEGKEEDD